MKGAIANVNTTLERKIELYRHLGKVLAKHSSAYAKQKTGWSQADPSELAEELVDDLEAMGPTFIKLGQLMAGRREVLPAVYHDALTRLQDDVEPIPFPVVEATLKLELGAPLNTFFASFDPEPIATASLGQVHKARRYDGRPVAVKVMRPGVEDEVARDLDALEDVAAFLDSRTQLTGPQKLAPLLENLRASLSRELDYRREGESLNRFRQMLSEFEHLVVPRYHEDLSSRRVLTMDLLNGTRIDSEATERLPILQRRRLAKEAFSAYLHQVLDHGVYHADPHPGNILLLATPEGPKLGVIDLGMVGHVTMETRQTMTSLLLQLAEGKAGKVADMAVQLAERQPDSDIGLFRNRVIEIVDDYRELPLADLKAGAVVLEIISAAGECNLLLPPQLSLLAKTLLHLDEVGKVLDPDFSPDEAIRENAARIIQSSFLECSSLSEAVARFHEIRRLVSQAPQQISQILRDLSEQNYTVQVDAINEREWIQALHKIANRLTAGLVLAALILGAAVMTHIETPEFSLFGYPAIAIITFILAGTGGAVLAFRVLWSDRL